MCAKKVVPAKATETYESKTNFDMTSTVVEVSTPSLRKMLEIGYGSAMITVRIQTLSGPFRKTRLTGSDHWPSDLYEAQFHITMVNRQLKDFVRVRASLLTDITLVAPISIDWDAQSIRLFVLPSLYKISVVIPQYYGASAWYWPTYSLCDDSMEVGVMSRNGMVTIPLRSSNHLQRIFWCGMNEYHGSAYDDSLSVMQFFSALKRHGLFMKGMQQFELQIKILPDDTWVKDLLDVGDGRPSRHYCPGHLTLDSDDECAERPCEELKKHTIDEICDWTQQLRISQ